MARTVVTPSPGFISIAVSDVQRSASFYERYLGAIRDTFDFGPESATFVGWPTFALSSARRPDLPGPSPATTSIQLWWRASDAQALYEQACRGRRPDRRGAVRRALRADVCDGRPRRLPDHRLREGSAALLAAQARLIVPDPGDRSSENCLSSASRTASRPQPNSSA